MSFSPRSWSPSESNILKAHSARTVGGVATLYKGRILYIVVMLHHVQMGAFSVANIWNFFNSLAWISLCIYTYPWMVDQQRMMGANEKGDMVIGQTK